MAREQEKFSQASLRTFRVFRDQHGRKWGADVEKSTQAPCGPLALRDDDPLVATPPVLPPQKYIVLKDVAAGEIEIAYDRWLNDLRESHREYEQMAFEHATRLYGAKAREALEEMPVDLRQIVGPDKPLDPRAVLAMRADNDWILGLSTERPKWADDVLPVREEADELAFLNEGTAAATDALDAAARGRAEFQAMRERAAELGLDIKGSGKNNAVTKADLEKALAAHDQKQPAGTVAGGVDPSWTE